MEVTVSGWRVVVVVGLEVWVRVNTGVQTWMGVDVAVLGIFVQVGVGVSVAV